MARSMASSASTAELGPQPSPAQTSSAPDSEICPHWICNSTPTTEPLIQSSIKTQPAAVPRTIFNGDTKVRTLSLSFSDDCAPAERIPRSRPLND
ncbi:hypothetical protein MJO28_001030 [Puccinia striiformis f. sp. tritici]|uniref:Uncharacterized protein n=1 Tax=Puccinia striiformis f. sp. tritici TaxID=168172 RepID=A0ACC0EZI1_9BASI|nr:hypothetical protein MJO28_001030 [Puccinia striiformis f. sp. tritici]